jgi:hypothetical protein
MIVQAPPPLMTDPPLWLRDDIPLGGGGVLHAGNPGMGLKAKAIGRMPEVIR